MNLFEFVFAFFAVFGSASFWFFWTKFVYSLEDKPKKEDTVNAK